MCVARMLSPARYSTWVDVGLPQVVKGLKRAGIAGGQADLLRR